MPDRPPLAVPPQNRDAALETIHAYHRRTKHALGRFAPGPGMLDWANQPDPFRRFAGAPVLELPLLRAPAGLLADPPASLSPDSLGLFFELGLGLTAWKQLNDIQWSLRANPSSGNLHPTECYALLPAVAQISDQPALYHYAPREHGLELRCQYAAGAMAGPDAGLPDGCFLIALSSIHWRESWKYGERAYRYCQHDAGHAIGSLAYAAAILGWRMEMHTAASDKDLSRIFGFDRRDAQNSGEAEFPDLMAVISTAVPQAAIEPDIDRLIQAAETGVWRGTANQLSSDQEDWPWIAQAEQAAGKLDRTAEPEPHRLTSGAAAPDLAAGSIQSTIDIIRRRRSAVAMDGETSITGEQFFRMLQRTLPAAAMVPWTSFCHPPRIALCIFVHRVDGVAPGLYALMRDRDRLAAFQAAARPEFTWRPTGPDTLPLYELKKADFRQVAAMVSCTQDIASDGAFSLGMVADFSRTLSEEGAAAYRRLFWESGIVGQVLYLEAEAAGVQSTGIGCFFDDQVHRTLGFEIDNNDWQSLYHFTVGRGVADTRLMTLPAYHHLAEKRFV